MKSAAVCKFTKRYVVHPYSTGRTGIPQACEPFIAVKLDDDGSGLVTALSQALEVSSRELPRPGVSFSVRRLFKLAGIKGWSQYRPAAFCHVERDEKGTVWITPLMPDPPGYGPVRDAKRMVKRTARPATLAREVLAALAISARRCAR